MPYAKAWSFSSLTSYEECPHRVKLKAEKATTLPREESRGERIHKLAEDYVAGKLDKLPHELRKFEGDIEEDRRLFAEGKVELEGEWGFTPDWQPTGWFDAWFRAKLDQFHYDPTDGTNHAMVVDWKTGKSFGNEIKYASQGQLYALACFMRHPELETVEVIFRFIDEGKSKRKTYVQNKQLDRMFERWMERAHRMLTDDECAPKPHRIRCKYCLYGPTNGSSACGWGIPWE